SCFIDGKLARKNVRQEYGKEFPGFFLGGVPGASGLDGIMREARISKSARYHKDFKPAPRFETDGDTLALYHFDEGNGDTLKDASGHGHHGNIVGAAWVNADGTPIKNSTGEKTFTNTLGMEFVLVPKGKSWLGGGNDKPGDQEIEVLHDFFLGK